MTLKLMFTLLVLHLLSAFTVLAFSPDSCNPGDVGCGDTSVTELVERRDQDVDRLPGVLGLAERIWESIKGPIEPLINLISFDHPWLRGDMPELASWIVESGQTFLALLHIYVGLRLLLVALGRGSL